MDPLQYIINLTNQVMFIFFESLVGFFTCVFDIQYILLILFWSYVTMLVAVLLSATVGKKFGIRKKYILILDKVFFYVATKTESKEQVMKENKEDEQDEDFVLDEEVVISPECPLVVTPLIPGQLHFSDTMPYLAAGMKAVVEDFVKESFTPVKLGTWNMLSRTKKEHKIPRSISVTFLWLVGFIIRYGFLVPARLVILVFSLATMVTCTFLVGRLPDGELKRKVNAFVVCWSFDFVANTLSVVARFHNKENKPLHGVAVANHTSPIDSMVLATDNCYDMVGQITGGFLGIFMTSLSKSSSHIWFERTNADERRETFKRLNIHAQNKDLPPILVYPEGICVNNSAVLMFRKGVFELDTVIYPVAIKFDSRFGDSFWYKHGFFFYIVSLISSWAIVCDVWYLPPMKRRDDEDPIQFAKRVNSAIAAAGGFKQIGWDGFVKLIADKPQSLEKCRYWLQRHQQELAKSYLAHVK